MALKANAGFVRFQPPANQPVVFQVGIRTANSLRSLSGQLAAPFTAFEVADNVVDGAIIYDTVVYISNRTNVEIQVPVKITNAEDGQPVVDSFVTIGPWKMLAYSLAGALK